MVYKHNFQFATKQKNMLVTHVLLIFLFLGICTAEQKCQSRDYGNGATVCVCNSEYCDTIDPLQPVASPQYLKYTSNKAGLRHEKEVGTFQQSTTATNIIHVNTQEKYQKILGWGGAFTDSTGLNINLLDEAAQELLLESYFSEQGLEYSLCRVPIGGTDFSTRGYSYDDGDIDMELANFQLAEEDFAYKIPIIKRAMDLTKGNLELFASAWTAPKWMKTNGEYNGLGYLIDSMYQTWADYFVKFLDSYRDEGVEFWGITTGNEPYTANIPFEQINTVGWLPENMSVWIVDNLGPALRNSSHSDIKLMILDDNRLYIEEFVNTALASDDARQYVDGIAVHWYADFFYPPSILTDAHNNFPELFILNTEASNAGQFGSADVILGSWERGEVYAQDIIQDVLHWVGGWVDWSMVLDLTGGPTYISNFVDSPVIVNATAGEFYKQPMFYALGHFSKFVPRGSVRVNTTTDVNVQVAAFERPDNGTVLVILNKNQEVVSVTIVDDVRGNADMELSERSITTVLYW